MTQTSPDKYVELNRKELLERSLVGIKKYNTSLDTSNQRGSEWVQHAIEESLDLANYLQTIKQESIQDEIVFVQMEHFLLGVLHDHGATFNSTVEGSGTVNILDMLNMVTLRINKKES